MLLSLEVPVFAIDTRGSSLASQSIDMLYNAPDQSVPSWPDQVKSLCPVPILRPWVAGSYRSLPNLSPAKRSIRNGIRDSLGLPTGAKTVLFCTAEWQHPKAQPAIRRGTKFESQWDIARRFAYSLPKLIAAYLRKVPHVHLVHVGPEAYETQHLLADRYHWLPPLPPHEFDPLVASMDLLLTANISATTIAKAMVSGVPILALQNSVSASNREEVEAALGMAVSAEMADWLRKSLPLFPFALWPLGYYRFVAPILKENPYLSAIGVVELLNEQQVEESFRRLLFDNSARARQLHHHAAYLSQVRSLPTGAQALHAAFA